jgi:hypothetical protein
MLGVIFHLRTSISYAPVTNQIPAGATWFLLRERSMGDLRKKYPSLREITRAGLDSEQRDQGVLLYLEPEGLPQAAL